MNILLPGERLAPRDYIPTPIYGLNRALGGGFCTNGISSLWGIAHCGKSTLALHTAAKAQQQGYTLIYVDTEHSYTDEYAEICGVDIDNRYHIPGNIVEDILKGTSKPKKKPGLFELMSDPTRKIFIVVDSINGLIFDSFNKEAASGKDLGHHSRAQKYLATKMASCFHPNMAAIFIAQASVDITAQKPTNTINMGNGAKHWSLNIIHLFASMAKDSLERNKTNDLIVSQKITWRIDKSKQEASTGAKGFYWYHYQAHEFDTAGEIASIAAEAGIIRNAGAYFYIDELDLQVKGKKGLAELLEDDNVMSFLRAKLDSLEVLPSISEEDDKIDDDDNEDIE